MIRLPHIKTQHVHYVFIEFSFIYISEEYFLYMRKSPVGDSLELATNTLRQKLTLKNTGKPVVKILSWDILYSVAILLISKEVMYKCYFI